MLYSIVKSGLSAALRQFFRSMDVRGNAVEKSPLILVGNHQNLALDSLVISAGVKRPLWYLAKATLFSNPIADWTLRALHVAPLYRRQDDPALTSKNEETFNEVVKLLKIERCVLLFPEGVSKGERLLSPIKTGAARMAYLACKQNIPVKIQAAGLTYTDLERFQSSVTLTFSEAFDVAALVSQSEQDERVNVQRITAKIEEELRKVTVDIKVREHEALVENVAKLYRSRGSKIDDRERFGLIAKNIEALGPDLPEKNRRIGPRIQEYVELAGMLGFDGDESFEHRHSILTLFITGSVVGIGAALCYLPYRLVGIISRRLSSHPVYVQSSKFFLGLLLFAGWFIVVSVACWILTDSWLMGLITLLGCCLIGYITNRYLAGVRIAILSGFRLGTEAPLAKLKILRDELIAELEALRVV